MTVLPPWRNSSEHGAYKVLDTYKEVLNFKEISKLQKTGICLLGQKVTLLWILHPVPSAEQQGNCQGLEVGQWEHDFPHYIGDWKVLKEWKWCQEAETPLPHFGAGTGAATLPLCPKAISTHAQSCAWELHPPIHPTSQGLGCEYSHQSIIQSIFNF